MRAPRFAKSKVLATVAPNRPCGMLHSSLGDERQSVTMAVSARLGSCPGTHGVAQGAGKHGVSHACSKIRKIQGARHRRSKSPLRDASFLAR